MQYKTHITYALLFWIFIIKQVNISLTQTIVSLCIILFATLLPDIDTPTSKLGRFVPLLGWLVSHRGIFHTIWMTISLSALMYLITFSKFYTVIFFAGYLLHLLLDALTQKGVKFFWPFQYKINGVVRTGGLIELILFLGGIVWIIIILF